jgi:transposase
LRDAVAAEIAACAAAIEVEREARLRAERGRADMAERVARLEHLIAELRRARFGRSSEKLSADQLELAFEDIETAIVEAQAEAGAAAEPAPKADCASKPRRRSRALPKDLPREERVIEPDDLSWSLCRAIGPSDNGDAAAAGWSGSASCRRHASGVTTAPSGSTSPRRACG